MKEKKQPLFRYFKLISILLTIILLSIYIIVYILYVIPMYKLHVLQTKSWIENIQTNIIVGVYEPKRWESIGLMPGKLSFWYNYMFIHTDQYTVYIYMNKHNKFSDRAMITVAIYDINKKSTSYNNKPTLFNNIQSHVSNGILTIENKDGYYQTIDFNNNITHIHAQIDNIDIHLEIAIDDYTTNQPTLLPRFQSIKNFTNIYGKQTWTPNEWFTDNPLIGKVTKGSINGSPVNNGQFWFDNFIGVNNYYLSQYIWFVIMNDDWLIYILFFGEYDKRNNADTSKPIIIKHRKTNTLIYSGCDGHLPVIYKPFNPIKNITYNMTSSLGDDSLGEFDVSFQSHDINIKIKSIDVASRIFSVPYYESNDININNLNEWDATYYKIIRNLYYVEYVGQVEVNIDYNNKKETFQSRIIVDGVYRKSLDVPKYIKY